MFRGISSFIIFYEPAFRFSIFFPFESFKIKGKA